MNATLAQRLGRPDLASYTALASQPATGMQSGPNGQVAVALPGQTGLAMPNLLGTGADTIAQGRTALLILAGFTLGIIGVSVWTRGFRK